MRLPIAMMLLTASMISLSATTASPADKGDKTDEPKKTETKTPSFKTDVMPILTDACVNCHGANKKKGRIDVSTYEGVAKIVKAGDIDKSRLIKSVTGKGAKLMPPKAGLPDEKIQVLKDWIAAGAKND